MVEDSPVVLVPVIGAIPIFPAPNPSQYARKPFVAAVGLLVVLRIEPAKVPGVAEENTAKMVKELEPLVRLLSGSENPPDAPATFTGDMRIDPKVGPVIVGIYIADVLSAWLLFTAFFLLLVVATTDLSVHVIIFSFSAGWIPFPLISDASSQRERPSIILGTAVRSAADVAVLAVAISANDTYWPCAVSQKLPAEAILPV